MKFNVDPFHKGLMCQKDAVAGIYWPGVYEHLRMFFKTKQSWSCHTVSSLYFILSLAWKEDVGAADGQIRKLYSAHLEFRGWKMNRPMRVKLLYHVKYVIEQHAYGYFNRERENIIYWHLYFPGKFFECQHKCQQ